MYRVDIEMKSVDASEDFGEFAVQRRGAFAESSHLPMAIFEAVSGLRTCTTHAAIIGLIAIAVEEEIFSADEAKRLRDFLRSALIPINMTALVKKALE